MKYSWTIFEVFAFAVLFPLVDSGADVNFSIRAFSNQHYLIGSLILSPVIANILFICSVWKKGKFDQRKEKWFTWILAVLTLWPPYQAVKLIRNIIAKKEDRSWEAIKVKLENQVFSIEPWIESIPQYIITICVYEHYFVKEEQEHGLLCGSSAVSLNATDLSSRNAEHIEDIFGKITFFLPTRIMFPINAAISFFLGVHSIIMYLNIGPLKITSEKFSWLLFVFKLTYVVLSFLSLLLGAFDNDIVAQCLGLGGYWSFIFDLITFIILPFLLFIGPMIRYLGPKKYAKMILTNPQLVILPIVTDYVIGPVNGYGRCNAGCGCTGRLICCWMCCSKTCKYEHGSIIGIRKQMSIAKMAYKQIFVAIPVVGAIEVLIRDSGNLVAIGILVAWFIGTFSFLMTLCLGNFSSIHVDKIEESDGVPTHKYRSALISFY